MGLFTLDEDLLPDSEKPFPEEKKEKKKPVYLVTDTSWWLEQGWRIATEVAERLKDGEAFFVIPAGVMRELDGLKRNPEKGKKALESTKRIHELVRMGRCRIVKGNGTIKGVLASPVDEEVLSVAREWKEKGETYLLTTDRAQMAVAEFGKLYTVKFHPTEEDPLVKFIDRVPWILRVWLVFGLLPFWLVYFKFFYKKSNTYELVKLPSKKILDDHFPGNVGCPCSVCSDDD